MSAVIEVGNVTRPGQAVELYRAAEAAFNQGEAATLELRGQPVARIVPLAAGPVTGLTEHLGYVVRAVIEGTRADWQLPSWLVAAEHPGGGWFTWSVVDDHGRLLWCCPGRYGDRAAALADLAGRVAALAAPDTGVDTGDGIEPYEDEPA
jgi:hypothetical protein